LKTKGDGKGDMEQNRRQERRYGIVKATGEEIWKRRQERRYTKEKVTNRRYGIEKATGQEIWNRKGDRKGDR
jgi:hypothetical protein